MRQLYPLLILTAFTGCQSYRPAPVLVRDAETGQPIVGADVHISYPGADSSFAPTASSGPSGADGIARLQAAPYGDAGILVTVAAKGYLNEHEYVAADEVKALEPAHWFEDVAKRRESLVVALLAEPRPYVELVLPSYTRGVVKTIMHIDDKAPFTPGQRCFIGTVSPFGEVEITGPPLLRHASPIEYRAKFTDGAPLGLPENDNAIGFGWLKSDGKAQYYFVGTKSEYEAARQLARAWRPTANPTKGGGQGHHGHKGAPDGGS
jgi:hypothetical protein